MKNIAIVGTGLAAMSVIEALKKDKRVDITIFESGNLNKTKKNKERFNFKKSFKYSSEEFKSAKKKFLNNYKIKEKNFFLPNVNCIGGLSNFWGGGIEIPNKKFLSERKLPLKLLKEVSKVKKLFNFDNKVIKNLRKHYYYKIIDKLKNKSFKIDNLNISLKGNKSFSTKNYFLNISKKKNINLLFNHHIETISKKKNLYTLQVKSNKNIKYIDKKFDIIILCSGTVASTLIVAKFLDLQNLKIRFYNNPMMQICFYNPNLYFKKINDVTFSHPLKNFHQKIRSFENKGSLIPLKFFANYHLGYSNKNIFMNFLKKGMIVGNIFFDSRLTKNYIKFSHKKNNIHFSNNINKFNILKKTKKNFLDIFKKLNFFPVPFLNFKTFDTGSDAHYTSSLYELYLNKKKIIKKNCELRSSKNFYILDGSVIPYGTFYPSFLISLNAYYHAKKLLRNVKNK